MIQQSIFKQLSFNCDTQAWAPNVSVIYLQTDIFQWGQLGLGNACFSDLFADTYLSNVTPRLGDRMIL